MVDGQGVGFNNTNNDGDVYGRGGFRRPVRKERDDKVHDSVIEECIQRERPCTLFIRNIKASHHIENCHEFLFYSLMLSFLLLALDAVLTARLL
jgi:hypothetical protein